MRLLRGFLFYFSSVLLVFVFIHILVWKLPGSVADFVSDSETNLFDLKKISTMYVYKENFFSRVLSFFFFRLGIEPSLQRIKSYYY